MYRQRSLRPQDGDFYIPYVSTLLDNQVVDKLTEHGNNNHPLFVFLITHLPTSCSQATIEQSQWTTLEDVLSEPSIPIRQITDETCGKSGHEFLALVHSIIVDSIPFLGGMRSILSCESIDVLGVSSSPPSSDVRSRLSVVAEGVVKSIYLAPTDPNDGFTAIDTSIFINSRTINLKLLGLQSIPFAESAEWAKL